MNKHLSLLFSILFLSFSCYSQVAKKDTIYVTAQAKTYVVFPDLVDWVDIGIANYLSKKSGKTVFFAADKAGLEPALLVIKYGDKMWHGTIAYKESLDESEQFLNLNDYEAEQIPDFVNEERVKKDESVSLDQIVIKRRLGILEGNTTEEEKTFAILQDKIIFKVAIFRQDEDHYYFKLAIYNKSKLEYVIDVIDFQYLDVDPVSNLESTHYEYPQDFYANKTNKAGSFHVPEKDVINLYYAIKKYKVSTKGKLRLTVREKEGTRILSFEIPQDDLLKINTF